MVKNWIFDWSGTLVDDMALVLCATNYVFREYGLEQIDRDLFRRSFRLPYKEFYDDFLPDIALDEIEAHFRKGFDVSTEVVPILAHAREFLDYLQLNGCRMFVLTSMCSKAFAEQLQALELGSYFEQTYSGVLDKRELIGEILGSHTLAQEETVFVGDMTHDVHTAHHGGVWSVGVLTGYNHRETLEESNPSLLVGDLHELRALLESGQQLFIQKS